LLLPRNLGRVDRPAESCESDEVHNNSRAALTVSRKAPAPTASASRSVAIAGIGTVVQAVEVNDADYRILMDASASIDPDDVAPLDETHNCGETERELLLRPEAEVLLGRDVRKCSGRPPDLCDPYNRMRLTRAGGRTAERPPPRECERARIAVA
jgi:hypothetical protein